MKWRFERAMVRNSNQDLTVKEFSRLLVSQKLLRDDYPMTDDRWVQFYSKFIVIDENTQEPGSTARESADAKYSLIPTLIALIFLS